MSVRFGRLQYMNRFLCIIALQYHVQVKSQLRHNYRY